MNGNVPDEVLKELRKSQKKVTRILEDFNKKLDDLGFAEWVVVAVDFIRNDPELSQEVKYEPVFLIEPISVGDETDLIEGREITETAVFSPNTETAVFSPNEGEIFDIAIAVAQPATNKCNATKLGNSCGGGKRCKVVRITGRRPWYICLPAKNA